MVLNLISWKHAVVELRLAKENMPNGKLFNFREKITWNAFGMIKKLSGTTICSLKTTPYKKKQFAVLIKAFALH